MPREAYIGPPVLVQLICTRTGAPYIDLSIY